MKPASSTNFANTVIVRPGPSRTIARALWVVHGFACIALLLAMPSLPLALMCCLILVLSAWLAHRRHVSCQGGFALTAATWHPDGRWHIEAADGKRIDVDLLPSTFIYSHLVVLHFKPEKGRRRFMILCRDSLSPPVFRRLRARLRVSARNDEAVEPFIKGR